MKKTGLTSILIISTLLSSVAMAETAKPTKHKTRLMFEYEQQARKTINYYGYGDGEDYELNITLYNRGKFAFVKAKSMKLKLSMKCQNKRKGHERKNNYCLLSVSK